VTVDVELTGTIDASQATTNKSEKPIEIASSHFFMENPPLY
jgi:hypothetical protein